jgi:glutamate--cysteine ligase
VSFNSLESYSGSLSRALTQPYPPYEAIGLRDGDEYRQLASSLLQIENEFYGTIRPKRTIRPGERPLRALAQRGVEYVEVRCLDLDPFHAIGIGEGTLRFLDVFLLHCLLSESPPDSPEEIAAMSRNQHLVAQRGREPGLVLRRGLEDLPLPKWGRSLVRECEPIADALDAACGLGAVHRRALAAAEELLEDASKTPSARVLREMNEQHADSFPRFALARSLRHRSELLEMPLSAEAAARQARMAEASLAEQRRIEAADTLPFEEYRRRYIAGELVAGD